MYKVVTSTYKEGDFYSLNPEDTFETEAEAQVRCESRNISELQYNNPKTYRVMWYEPIVHPSAFARFFEGFGDDIWGVLKFFFWIFAIITLLDHCAVEQEPEETCMTPDEIVMWLSVSPDMDFSDVEICPTIEELLN